MIYLRIGHRAKTQPYFTPDFDQMVFQFFALTFLNQTFLKIQSELSPDFSWKKVWGLDLQLKQDYNFYITAERTQI